MPASCSERTRTSRAKRWEATPGVIVEYTLPPGCAIGPATQATISMQRTQIPSRRTTLTRINFDPCRNINQQMDDNPRAGTELSIQCLMTHARRAIVRLVVQPIDDVEHARAMNLDRLDRDDDPSLWSEKHIRSSLCRDRRYRRLRTGLRRR